MERASEGRVRRRAGVAPTLAATSALALAGALAVVALCAVQGVLLSPLPFDRPSELVMVWESRPADGVERNPVSRPNFVDWRRDNPVFTDMAAYYVGVGTLTGGADPERVRLAVTTAALFPLLGAEAQLGRVFTRQEDRPGFDHVAVLSDALWRRSYGADPSVVGRTVELDGLELEVLGVLPPGFEFPRGVDLWAPIAMDPEELGKRGGRHLTVLARLENGVSRERAAAAMRELARGQEREYPDTQTGWSAEVVPLVRELQGTVRPGVVVLAVVALLLWVGATATAGVWLRGRPSAGRAPPRSGSAVLVVLAASGLGLGLGAWAVTALSRQAPSTVAAADRLQVGGFEIAMIALLALMSGPWLAVWPPTARGAAGGVRLGRPAWAVLATLQGFLTSVLLGLAVLLALSYGRLSGTDPGFDPGDLLTVSLDLPRASYPDGDAVLAFTRTLLDRMEALRGVESAAVASALPISGVPRLWNNTFEVVDRPPPPQGEKTRSHLRWVSHGYFETLGVPLLRGRGFEAADQRGRPEVIVIDEEMSRQYFAGEDPLRREVIVRVDEPVPRRVVGVVATVKQSGLDEPPVPHMYLPQSQTPPAYLNSGWLVVRTRGRPEDLAAAVRQEVRRLDPGLPVAAPKTMEERIAASIAGLRFAMESVGAVAAGALLLSLLLGAGLARARSPVAPSGRVPGAIPVAAGVFVGSLALLATGPWMSRTLFEVGVGGIAASVLAAQVFFIVSMAAAFAAGRRGISQARGGSAVLVGPSTPEGQP